MLIEELYEHFGSWAKLTRALKLGQNAHYQWRQKGYIPLGSQLMIERRSNGRFIASEDHARLTAKKGRRLPSIMGDK